MSQAWGVGDPEHTRFPVIWLDDDWHEEIMMLAEAHGLTLLRRAREGYGDATYVLSELDALLAELDQVAAWSANGRVGQFVERLKGTIAIAQDEGMGLFESAD